jgi:hypothetical protein
MAWIFAEEKGAKAAETKNYYGEQNKPHRWSFKL